MREISRREFLKITGVLAGGIAAGSPIFVAGCGYPIATEINNNAYIAEGKTVSIMLEHVPQLSQVGGSAAIVNDADKIHLIIARTDKDRFVTALNACPHREKLLGYDHEARLFICASGKSKFRLDGYIVAGPAENPLRIYQSYLDQHRLTINL